MWWLLWLCYPRISELGSRQLPVLVSRGVDYSLTRWVGDSGSRCLNTYFSKTLRLKESWSCRLPVSVSQKTYDSLTRRVRESLFEIFKFWIDFQTHAFKGPIWQNIGQGCNALSLLIYLQVWKKANSKQPCRPPDSTSGGVDWLPDSTSWGVDFRLRISPQIWSKSRNSSNSSVRDQCRTDLCKNLGKFGSLPCPFK